MPPGKLAAQAGHAFLGAFIAASNNSPALATEYASDPPGTKICLAARDEAELLALHELAAKAGIPSALITDSGHILPPHFDGSPIVTALGLGPTTRKGVARLTRRLQPI